MIYAICGRPGSGKSYESVVYHILPALRERRKVITNVPLNIDKIVSVFGEDIRRLIVVIDGQLNNYGVMDRPFSKPADYFDDWRSSDNRGALIVVDEAHMVLPNRNVNTEILEYYSLHRHYGVDIILLTQNLRKIHRDIKAMVEITYYCAKNTAFGSDKTYTKKVKIGDTSEVVNTEVRKLKSSYYPFYQSHTESDGAVVEAAAKDIKPLYKTWPFVFSAILIPVGVVWTILAITGGNEPSRTEIEKKTLEKHVSETSSPGRKISSPTVEKRVKKDGFSSSPLGDFRFFVTGYAKQTVKPRRLEDMDFSTMTLYDFHIVYLDVYKGSDKLFSLTSEDLIELGYSFVRLSECVYRVSYNSSSRVLTCKEPEHDRFKSPALDTVNNFNFVK